ncbi:ABC transporter permease subunit, partial [Mycoplasmopsis synoviae]
GTSDLTLAITLIVVGWPGSVGITKLYIITVKNSDFIQASKLVGASKIRLILRHALPASVGKIANSFVAYIPSIILSVSALAFLRFFKGNTANLGTILSSESSETGKNI